MHFNKILREEAVRRGIIEPGRGLEPALAFTLVRDIPYQRATSREPEVTIQEWRGTCSGKHYLLKRLFAEFGLEADLIACTVVSEIDPASVHPELGVIVEETGGRFVDVHNYLVLKLPDGDMVVDATWPLSTREHGLVVNESFHLGESQKIAAEPFKTWVIPEEVDPDEFKDRILREHFTPLELAVREAFIQTLSRLLVEG